MLSERKFARFRVPPRKSFVVLRICELRLPCVTLANAGSPDGTSSVGPIPSYVDGEVAANKTNRHVECSSTTDHIIVGLNIHHFSSHDIVKRQLMVK